jgi:hypothetical protein
MAALTEHRFDKKPIVQALRADIAFEVVLFELAHAGWAERASQIVLDDIFPLYLAAGHESTAP